MQASGWIQFALFIVALAVITKPMGLYLLRVLDAKGRTWLDPVLRPLERGTYRIIGVDPNNAVVHKIYGQVVARRQPPNAELAIQAYNRSLQSNPNDAETHKLVGDVFYFLRKQPTQAIQPYTQSIRLNTNDFETHQRLAKCYEETGQLDAALREYLEAVRLLPPALKRPELHYALGQLAYRMRQWQVAERAFVQVLTINSADHATRFLLSQVYEQEGKLADAQRECGYVVQVTPTNQAAQVMLQRLRGLAR